MRHAVSVIPTLGGPDDDHRPLTAEGVAQAAQLVDQLASLEPTAVYSSPYLRSVQTVEPTARALGMSVRVEPDLREWESGLDPTPDYERHFAESWGEPLLARPGGESLQQVTDRALAALRAIADRHPSGPVVVGSHGTFISRALVGFGRTAVDWEFSRTMPSPAIYRLRT